MKIDEHLMNGRIFVLSAPSGAGKTTLVNNIKKKFPFLVESVSMTTRKPRSGEIEGKDYFFVSSDDFLQKKEAGLFAEWAEVHGNFYGTPLSFLKDTISMGKHVICDIDYQGAINIWKAFRKEAVLIFILPPSMDELEKRLRGRATDNEEIVQKRLENARKEIGYFTYYNYIIVNDDVVKATDILSSIIISNTEASVLKNIETISKFIE
ncbi:MAG TPA: guanylate kinase [bacterium]|nr:guanylate kinase [bacterium]HPS29392.1 guanylate kinase [bacterium]